MATAAANSSTISTNTAIYYYRHRKCPHILSPQTPLPLPLTSLNAGATTTPTATSSVVTAKATSTATANVRRIIWIYTAL